MEMVVGNSRFVSFSNLFTRTQPLPSRLESFDLFLGTSQSCFLAAIFSFSSFPSSYHTFFFFNTSHHFFELVPGFYLDLFAHLFVYNEAQIPRVYSLFLYFFLICYILSLYFPFG